MVGAIQINKHATNMVGTALIDNSRITTVDYGWKLPLIVLVMGLATATGLYWDTLSYLVGIWNQILSGKVTHGWVVIGLCVSMIYRERNRLATLVPMPNFAALLLVGAASSLWFAAYLVDIRSAQPPALLLVLLGTVWTTLGSGIFRRLLFPLLFLSLALPVWASLKPVLQWFTAVVTHIAISSIGVPTIREGMFIELPPGIFEVSESCSGINYLLAALTLSGYYAYINYSNIGRRLAIVAIAAGMAIFGNLLRVSIILYIGYRTEMRSSLVNDHLTMGWILFGILMFLLLWIDDRRLGRVSKVEHTDIAQRSEARMYSHYSFVVMIPLVIMATSIGPTLGYFVGNAQVDTNNIDLWLPQGTQGWQGPTPVNNGWNPTFVGVSGSSQGTYRKNTHSVSLFVGYYAQQNQENELINAENSLAGSTNWHVLSGKKGVKRGDMREIILRSDSGQKRLLWYCYEVGGHRTTSRYMAKVFQLWGLVVGRTEASVYAITASQHDDDPSLARALLQEFVNTMMPLVEGSINSLVLE